MILCLDPGSVNFGYSILSMDGKIVDFGMLPPVTNLKDEQVFNLELRRFIKNLPDYNPEYIVYERFIPRFVTKGNTSEIINVLLGIIIQHYYRKNTKFISVTAATWKGFFKKNELMLENSSLPIHILDGIAIGLYFLWKRGIVDVEYIKYFKRKIHWIRIGNFFKNYWT